MANMVNKVNDYTNRKTILIGQESYYLALPVKLSGSANAVVKAGQPLAGDLTDRNTAFTASTSSSKGILLHEVKLDADGKGNGTIVIRGCVDAKKLDAAIVTAIGTANLEGIVVVEGSAI